VCTDVNGPDELRPAPSKDEAHRAEMIEAPRDAMGLMAHPIDALFRPRSIAVIGATDKPPKRGASVLVNPMTNACGATVYPVNPQHATVFDRPVTPRSWRCPAGSIWR
jgi:hypothetical protein